MTVDLKNSARIEQALLQISGMLEAAAIRQGTPTLEPTIRGEHTVYTVKSPEMPMPFAPSFVIHNDHLLISMFPQVTAPYTEPSEYDKKLDLTDLVDLDGAVGFKYMDVRRQYELLYTYAAAGHAMMGSIAGEIGAGPDAEFVGELLSDLPLPSLRSVYRHVTPSVATLRKDENGWQATNHQTVPSVNLAVASPIAVGLILPAVQSARAASRRMQSTNNLKQMQLALLNYESAYKRFPAAYSYDEDGKPLLSWRVHILPFIGEVNLYEQFKKDEPWDSEHNIQLLDKMPDVYRSPVSTAEAGKTVYLGVGGEQGVLAANLNERNPTHMKGTSFGAIVDGSSNTISIVEASDELAVEWTKPTEFVPKAESFGKLFGNHTGGTNAAFVDGSVQFISEFIDEEVLEALFTRAGGEVVDRPF